MKRESPSAAILCKRDQWRTQAGVAQAGERQKILERGERSHGTVVERRVGVMEKVAFLVGSNFG